LKIITIIGARPQFIKHFSFEKACKGKLELITVHTGQHYDANMSEVFFEQLKMDVVIASIFVFSLVYSIKNNRALFNE
jgi:UDP-N-acetylglucosamine 2-epimerase